MMPLLASINTPRCWASPRRPLDHTTTPRLSTRKYFGIPHASPPSIFRGCLRQPLAHRARWPSRRSAPGPCPQKGNSIQSYIFYATQHRRTAVTQTSPLLRMYSAMWLAKTCVCVGIEFGARPGSGAFDEQRAVSSASSAILFQCHAPRSRIPHQLARGRMWYPDPRQFLASQRCSCGHGCGAYTA